MSAKVAPPRLPRRSPVSETRGLIDSAPKKEIRAPSWRDWVRLHPAAELLPMMTDAELDTLGKDIAEHGLTQHLVLWTPHPTEGHYRAAQQDEFLLDGRNRLEAIVRGISDPKRREEAILHALSVHYGRRPDATGGAIRLYGDVDPYAFVLSANLYRRHLTRQQQRQLLEALIMANPERSNRDIARLAKRSDKTVEAVRRRLEATAEIPQFEKTTGADGKARPTRRESTREAAKLQTSAAQSRTISLLGFLKNLHRRPAETLYEVTRLLRAEHARIADLPLQTRIELARANLQALDVSLDDLSLRDV